MRAHSIPLDHLPPDAAAAATRLREELLRILGDDLVSLWVHGGTTFDDRPIKRGDLDIGGVIANVASGERRRRDWGDDPTSRPSRVYAAERTIADGYGSEIDSTYVRDEEAGQGELPTHAFRERYSLTDWAVFRAHLAARQYVHLHGVVPEALVVPPTDAELRWALDRELEHLERHVLEGDASDPSEATYAIWNGCRILHTLETGSPVVSKRSAGAWGLARLPQQWHDAIRAAGRSYDGEASAEDNELLRVVMPPFVAMVRERLPAAEARPPGPPRWGGEP